MPWKDKEKRRAHSAEYRKNNKEKIRAIKAKYRENNRERLKAQSAKWRKNNKEKVEQRKAIRQSTTQARKFSLIQQLGGKCVRCGENHPLLLDFHHQDPSTKENQVTALIYIASKYKEAQEEAQKCILLCSNCHRKEHHELTWLASFPGSDLYICPWEYSDLTKKKTKEKQEQEMEAFIETQLNHSEPYLI
jgi:hypothetical protein